MSSSPSFLMRALVGVVRGFLVIVALLLAFVVGAVAIVPLTIFVLPATLILGALLMLYVLGSTRSIATHGHARGRRPTSADRQARATHQPSTAVSVSAPASAPVVIPSASGDPALTASR